jgi:hypothetical protein
MKPVVGILSSREQGNLAVENLRATGVTDERINMLTPGAPTDLPKIAMIEAEQPGTATAIGGVVGGAVGAAGGLTLGTAMAGLVVPGIGGVIAIGLGAATVLGAAGAWAGATAGETLEDLMAPGIPIDELFLYEDALRRGRTVVIIFLPDEETAHRARQVLRDSGAESIDAARENWWIGLRDDERNVYFNDSEEPAGKQQKYRCGFETALHPALGRRPYAEAVKSLRAVYPEEYADESFRRGYRKGYVHYRELLSDR